MKTKAMTMALLVAVLAASIVLVVSPASDAETDVQADDSIPMATVTGLTVDGTVENQGTSVITYTASGGTLVWAPADESIDRNIGGWWYGYRFTIDVSDPSDLAKARFSNNNGKDWKDFLPVIDSKNATPVFLNAWGFINDAYIKNANGGYLTYTYLFDWNGNGTVDQTIYVKMDCADITLNDLNNKPVFQDGEYKGVAMMDGVIYTTIADAIDAATDGATIRLVTDVTEDVTIPSGKEVVLDLSGNKLTNVSTDTITVQIGATLTIKDTSTGGTVDNVTNARAALFNNGTVTIDGGIFERSKETGTSPSEGGKNTYYAILNHGTMVFNNGSVIQNGHYSSLIDNGYYSYSNTNDRNGHVEGTNSAAPELTINGGTFTGGLNTVKNDDGAKLTINGGTFDNYSQASVQNHNVATINGGTFTAVVDGGKAYAIDNCGCDPTHDVGLLTINGGTFTGDVYNHNVYGRIVINGGTFNGTFVGDNTDVTIKAGTFEEPVPSTFKVDSEALIDKTYYATFSDAVAMGGIVNILKDVTSIDPVSITKSITIIGGGKAIACPLKIVASGDEVLDVKVEGVKAVTINGDIGSAKVSVSDSDEFAVTFGTLKLTVPAGKAFAADGKAITVSEASLEGTVPEGFDLIVTSKATIPAGKTVEGAIWFDATKDNGITLSSVKAGTSGVTLTKGSVEIVGDFIATDGTITVTGIARIVGDSTIDGIKLVVPKGASLTVEEGASVTGTGSISNAGTVKVLGDLATALDNTSDAVVQVALTGSIDTDKVTGDGKVSFDSIILRDIGTKYYRVGDKVDIPVTVNPATATLTIDYTVSPSWLTIRDGHIVGIVAQDGSFNVTVKASMEDRETVSESFVINAVPGVDPQEPEEHEFTFKEIVKIAVIILVVLMVICLVTRAFIG